MYKHFFRKAATGLACVFLFCLPDRTFSQVSFTADEQVAPLSGPFRAGYNSGYQPGWNDQSLADIAAGNPAIGIAGVGCRTVRQGLYFELFNIWGYGIRLPEVQHYESLGMGELTGLIWGGANGGSEAPPPTAFRDLTEYCPGHPSEVFKNLYLPIWDGNNGTPINEDNFFAAYVYKTVETYRDHVRFWEIWNEPGFDFTGDKGWRPAGDPAGNWWDQNPDPCDFRLRAPIFNYVRMLHIAWEVVKTLDPDAFVCCGAPGYQSFLDAVLRNTDNPADGSVSADFPKKGGAYFDALCYHSYPHFDGSTVLDPVTKALMRNSDRAADGMIDTRNYFQVPLAAHGYDGVVFPKKQFVVTETNLPRRPFSSKSFFGSDLAQRNFMPKAVVNCMKFGIPQMDVFAIGERKLLADAAYEFDLMGLYQRLDNLVPGAIQLNEEGISLASTNKLLFGTSHDPARSAAIGAAANIRAEAFATTEPGKFIYAIWAKTQVDSSENAAATFSFPTAMQFESLEKAEWDYSQTGLIGGIAPTGIALTGTPIFLIGKDKSVATFSIKTGGFGLEISPNPARENAVTAHFFVEKAEKLAKIEVFDLLGNRVFSQNIENLSAGANTFKFPETGQFPAGQFVVALTIGGARSVARLVFF